MVRSCKLTEASTITNGASVVATKIFPTPIFFGSGWAQKGGERERGQQKAKRAKPSREPRIWEGV